MEEMKKKLAEYEQEKELFAAIDLLEQLIEAEPEDARAEQILRQHLQDEPENRWLQLNLGHALKALGKPEEAVENYLEVAKGEDAVSAIGFWSLANMRVFKFDDLFLTLLRDQVQQSEVGSPTRGLMLFALAAAWEQRENHEAAFMAMSEANLIFAAQRPFRGDLFGQMVKSMCDEVQVATDFCSRHAEVGNNPRRADPCRSFRRRGD
jgi:tetratricopeptide (TPR) repeat protein